MTGLDNPIATGGTAIVSALIIQALKNADWATWFNRQTPRANLVLSMIVAYATSIGVHFAWDGEKGTLLITGLTLAGIAHNLWQATLQWVAQHTSYKAFIVPAETLGEIRSLLQRSLPPPISEPEQKTQEAKP